MIIPSIDLMGGEAVQLVGGKTRALSAGDPRPTRRFGLAGEVAVIDLDAALSRGSNAASVRDLLRVAPCRVGGGIRDVSTAVEWLDLRGAAKIILGTAATPEVLRQLPPDWVIAALDADNGSRGRGLAKGNRRVDPRSHGPAEGPGRRLPHHLRGARGTHGRHEHGTRAGVSCRGGGPPRIRVTIAGGITTPAEVAQLDQLGRRCSSGHGPLYRGAMELADAIAAALTTDRGDGLWPTIVVDELGTALGLAYSSRESLRRAVTERRGIYHSRKRGVWVKGESSGNTQQLLRVDLDCDRDAIRFTVRQAGSGFCHIGTSTCWGPVAALSGLERRLAGARPTEGSYTERLLHDPSLLRSKLTEEAGELADASDPHSATHEAADLLYFAMVAMQRSGVSLADVGRELDRRALRLTRRPGNAKPSPEAVP